MSASEQPLPERPRVFISYSHDSAGHCDRVLALAQQLRRDGIAAELDQFHQEELVHWPRWCEEQLRPEKSNFVLCVCTPEYKRRVEHRDPADVGKGVFWEGTQIYNYLYNAKGNRRCLPVLLDKNTQDIPSILEGYTQFELDVFGLENSRSAYAKLYRLLTGQSNRQKTEVGALQRLPSLPEEERRTDFVKLTEQVLAEIMRVHGDVIEILTILRNQVPPASYPDRPQNVPPRSSDYFIGLGEEKTTSLVNDAFNMWFTPKPTRDLTERMEQLLRTAEAAAPTRDLHAKARLCTMIADQLTNIRDIGRAREYITLARGYLDQLDDLEGRGFQVSQDIVWIETIVQKLSGQLARAYRDTDRALAKVAEELQNADHASPRFGQLQYNYYRLLRSQISYSFEAGVHSRVYEFISRLELNPRTSSPLYWSTIKPSELSEYMQISLANARRLLTYDLFQIQRRVFGTLVNLGYTVKATDMLRAFTHQYLEAWESDSCDPITHINFHRLLGGLVGRCAIGTASHEYDALILLMKKAYSLEKRWTLHHTYGRPRIIQDVFHNKFFQLGDLDTLDVPHTVQEERLFLREAIQLLGGLHAWEPAMFRLDGKFPDAALPSGLGLVKLQHLNLFCAFDCSEAPVFRTNRTTLAQELCDTAIAFLIKRDVPDLDRDQLERALSHTMIRARQTLGDEVGFIHGAIVLVNEGDHALITALTGSVSVTLEESSAGRAACSESAASLPGLELAYGEHTPLMSILVRLSLENATDPYPRP
jgi:SEFIR domain-containing protein